MSTLKIVMNGLKPHSGGHPATDKLIVPYGAGWSAFWRVRQHLQRPMLRGCYRAAHLESAPPARWRAAVSFEPDILHLGIA
jgi:hypothetical protein